MCPLNFGDPRAAEPSKVLMKDVAGRAIKNHGKRQVQFYLDEDSMAQATCS